MASPSSRLLRPTGAGAGGAGESAPCRSYLLVAFAIFASLATSGLIYGFVALRHVMLISNIYSDQCSDDEKDDPAGCQAQNLRLDLMFIVAAFASNAIALPLGFVLDSYGPRTTGIFGSLMFGAGCVLFAVSSAQFDGYIPALALIAIGGACLFMAVINAGNAFPRYSGTIVGLIGGSFGLSSGVFFVFQETNASPHSLFFAYTGVGVLCLIGSVLLLSPASKAASSNEDSSAPAVASSASAVGTGRAASAGAAVKGVPAISNLSGDDMYSSVDSTTPNAAAGGSGGAMSSVVAAESGGLPILPVEGGPGGFGSEQRRNSVADPFAAGAQAAADAAAYNNRIGFDDSIMIYRKDDLTVAAAMRTTEFIGLVLVVSIWMLRINFYLTTVQEQFETLYPSDDEGLRSSQTLANLFSVLLAGGGFVCMTGTGTFIESQGLIACWTIVCALGVVFGITNLIPIVGVQYITIFVFVVFRPLLYAVASYFTGHMFGYHNFGKLYGVALFIASIVSTLQYAFDVVSRSHASYTIVNAVLTALTVPTLLFPLYLRRTLVTMQIRAVAERIHVVGSRISQLNSRPNLMPPPMSPLIGSSSYRPPSSVYMASPPATGPVHVALPPEAHAGPVPAPAPNTPLLQARPTH